MKELAVFVTIMLFCAAAKEYTVYGILVPRIQHFEIVLHNL